MHGRRTRAKRKKQYKNRRISPRQRRNRRILGAAIAAILIVLFLTSFFARPEPRIWYSYEVAPGDTLWAICRSEYGEGDIRRAVDLIVRENGIKDARIYPGEQLLLPDCK